jgi:hypothetical protein
VHCLYFFCNRAQKRIAQQRLDSAMDLGRIVDIRKKVFSEVKVSCHLYSQGKEQSFMARNRSSPTLAHKSATKGQSHKFGSLQIIRFLRLVVGRGQSSYGTYLLAPPCVRYADIVTVLGASHGIPRRHCRRVKMQSILPVAVVRVA